MVVSVGSTAVLARLLEPSAFGLATAALGILALPSSVFDGALGIRLIQADQLDDETVSNTLSVSILMSVPVTVILILAASPLESLMGFPGLANILGVSAIALVFRSMGSVARSILIRQRRLIALSLASVCATAVGALVVSCGLALAGFGVWSIIIGAIATTTIESLVNLWQAQPFWRPKVSPRIAIGIIRPGGLYALSQILNWVSNSGTGLVTGRALGAHDLGHYSRGNKLLEIVTSAVGEPTMRVLLPSFSRLQGDTKGARALFIRAISSSSIVFSVIGFVCVVHTGAIVLALLGPAWQDTVPIAQVLFLSLVARCNYKVTESVTFGMGAARLAVSRQAIFATIALTMVLLGTQFGLIGVAVGTTCGLWLIYLTSLVFASRLVGLHCRRLLKPHLIGLLWGGLVAGADLAMLEGALALGVNFWAAHLGAGFVALASLATFIAAAPRRCMPGDFARFRDLALAKLLRSIRRYQGEDAK